MSTKTAKPLKAGDQIHVLAGGVLFFGEALRRGDSITVTQRQIDEQRDTVGNSWADDLSEAAQLNRWGEVRLGFGPWPADLHTWLHGSPEWQEERESARQRAWRIESPTERAAARAKVEEEFGAAPSTSKTINKAPTTSDHPSGNASR